MKVLSFEEWLIKFKNLTLDDCLKLPEEKQIALGVEYSKYVFSHDS